MADSRGLRVVRDTAYLMTGQIFVGIVGLLSSAWLARNLPSGELSAWPACISLVTLTYTLSNFGFRNNFVREMPKLLSLGQYAEAGSMLRTGVLVTLSGSVLLSVPVYLFADGINRLLLNNEIPSDVVRLLAIAVFTTTISMHLEWFLNSVQEYKLFAISRTLRNTVRPLAAVVLYWVGGIEGAVLGLAIGPVLGCIVSAWALWPHLQRSNGLAPIGALLRRSMPYYASSISAGLISRMDYVLVGVLGGTKSLATYYIASRVVEYLQHVDTHLLDTLTPKLAEASVHGRSASEKGFTKCSRYFFLGLMPLHIGLAVVGRPLITLYAGEGYAAAGIIFSVLCIYLLIDTFFALYRQHIIALGNRWHPMMLDSALAGMNVVLIPLLSAHFGGLGAAAARGVSVLVVLPLALILIRSILSPRHSGRGALLGISGSMLAVVIAILWMHLFDSVAIQSTALVASGVVYVLLLHRQLTKDDMNIMRGLMPGRIRNSPTGQRISTMLERFYVGKMDSEASVTSQ